MHSAVRHFPAWSMDRCCSPNQASCLSTAVDEIARLKATDAYILGGTAAVSPSVEAVLNGLLAGTVTRIAGSNRYATARTVADGVITLQGAKFAGGAYVGTGDNFPDALGASLSGGLRVHRSCSPEAAACRICLRRSIRVTILGGTAAVTSKTESCAPRSAPQR